MHGMRLTWPAGYIMKNADASAAWPPVACSCSADVTVAAAAEMAASTSDTAPSALTPLMTPAAGPGHARRHAQGASVVVCAAHVQA